MVSCLTSPPLKIKQEFPEMAEVQAGMRWPQVHEKLGAPTARASGYWSSSNEFDMGFKVWYYKNRGRVVFSVDDVVYVTEADPHEDGVPGEDLP